jgi:hypothetical protein
MSTRIIKIQQPLASHWEYAVRNGFWDFIVRSSVAPGDEAYFWVGGSPGRVVGRARVTSGLRALTGHEPHAWSPDDPGRSRYKHRVDLTDFESLDVEIYMGELRSIGVQPSQAQVITVPDTGVSWFEQRMGVTDPFDQALAALRSDTSWAAMDIEVVEDDRRQKVPASVVIRRGQRRFREALLTAFDRCCAVSGCAVVELLEAAHISPYKGEHTDRPDNGLLLRADLHTLFDLDLLTIRATDLTIAVAPVIGDSLYRDLEGRALRSRTDRVEPNREFLLKHNHKCRWLLQDATTGGN